MKSMRLLLCLLVCSFQLRADVINGDTDPVGVPRDLSINKIFAGYDWSITTSVKNHVLTHLSGDNLRTFTAGSALYLENTFLDLDGSYTFTHGSVRVVGRVEIGGSGHNCTFGSHFLLIEDASELVIGPGVTFEFAPTCSLQSALRFASSSSKLTLDSSTLKVRNEYGMHLIGGNLNILGNSVIDNRFTDTHKALFLGTNLSGTRATGEGDCKLKINSGAKLTVKHAGVVYKNNGSGSFDASSGEGTLVIDSTGNFLFESVADFNDLAVSFDFANLEAISLLGALGVGNFASSPVAEIAYNRSMGEVKFFNSGQFLAVGGASGGLDEEIAVYSFDGSSLTLAADWAYNDSVISVDVTPDGKYVAAVGSSGSLSNDIAVYSFNGTSLAQVAIRSYGGAVPAWSVKFSPDGRYLAVGGFTGGTDEEIAVYRFDGSSLTKVAEVAYNQWVLEVAFSQDGKYLAVAGANGGADEDVSVYRFTGSSLTKVAERDWGAAAPLSVDFSRDGRYLAVGGNVGASDAALSVYRFDGSSLTLIAGRNPGSANGVGKVQFSPDGKYLAAAQGVSGSPDQEIIIYRFDGQTLTKLLEDPYNAIVSSVSFSPDGKYLAAGANTGGTEEEISVYEVNRYGTRSKMATFNDATVKLAQDLTLKDILLKTS